MIHSIETIKIKNETIEVVSVNKILDATIL